MRKTLINMPSIGDEICWEHEYPSLYPDEIYYGVVIDAKMDVEGWYVKFRNLKDGIDDPKSAVWGGYSWREDGREDKCMIIKDIVGKRYQKEPGGVFVPWIRDDLGEIVGGPYKFSDFLPAEHPLSKLSYYGGSDSVNLLILLETALALLEHDDMALPCTENYRTKEFIKNAIELQKERRTLRQRQGVLGTNKPHISEDSMI